MITNNDDTLKDVQAEIARNRKVLNGIYIETENLKRDKSSLEGDIIRLSKHTKFLEEEDDKKTNEISDKQAYISGLDVQVTEKSLKRDNLEHDINLMETDLINKKSEMAELIKKISEGEHYISSKHSDLNTRNDEIEEKNRKVEEKLDRIDKFLSELR